jgi:hypothetical protein
VLFDSIFTIEVDSALHLNARLVMSKIIEELRQKIDSKHARMLHALKELEDYLSEVPSNGTVSAAPVAAAPVEAAARQNRKPSSKRSSYTEKVLAAIDQEWISVQQISEKTGIDTKRIRGVLCAPRHRKRIQAKIINKEHGKKAYKYDSGSGEVED